MSGVEQASPIALRKSAVSSAPCESFVSDCGSERDTLRSAGNNSAVRDRSLPTFSVASQAIVFCQSPTIRHAREKSRRGRVAGEGRQFAGGSLRGSDDPFMDWLVSLSPKSSCSSINGSPRIVCVPESAVAGSPLHPSSEQSSVFMDAPLLESGSFCSQSSDGMSAMKQRHHLSAPPPLGEHSEAAPRISDADAFSHPARGGQSSLTALYNLADLLSLRSSSTSVSHKYEEKLFQFLVSTTSFYALVFLLLHGMHYLVVRLLLQSFESKYERNSLLSGTFWNSTEGQGICGVWHVNRETFLFFCVLSVCAFTTTGAVMLQVFLRSRLMLFFAYAVDVIREAASCLMPGDLLLIQQENAIAGALCRGSQQELRTKHAAGARFASGITQTADKPHERLIGPGSPLYKFQTVSTRTSVSSGTFGDFHSSGVIGDSSFNCLKHSGDMSPLSGVSFPMGTGNVSEAFSQSKNGVDDVPMRNAEASPLGTIACDLLCEGIPLPPSQSVAGSPSSEDGCRKTFPKVSMANGFSASLCSDSQPVTLYECDKGKSAQLPSSTGRNAIQNFNERMILETFGDKNPMLSSGGFLSQHVTFLVCRLFPPSLRSWGNGAALNRRKLKVLQAMSQQFLEVVLRVTKEEYGVPFDVKMDSAVITFHTPSGPNSVNLLRPRDCAFRLVSELQKVELQWRQSSPLPFVWGIAMHLSQLLVGVVHTPDGWVPSLYGEDIMLAYRVTELCRVTGCPLLLLQPCYDVFRVCMVAIPVDVINPMTRNSSSRIYLYEPKVMRNGEDLEATRRHYVPLITAFGLMCDKKFEEAAEQLGTIMDLDHNVPRLYRLCQYLSQERAKGGLDTLLFESAKYVRRTPQWQLLDWEAQKFIKGREACLLTRGSLLSSALQRSFAITDRQNNAPGDSNSWSTYYDGIRRSARTSLLPMIGNFFPLSRLVRSNNSNINDVERGFVHGIHTGNPSVMHGKGDDARSITNCHTLAVSVEKCKCGHKRERSVTVAAAHLSDVSEDGGGGGGNDTVKIQFDILEAVGTGSFGTVYRGIHPDGNIVAIKEYPLPSMNEDHPDIQSSLSEIRMLSACRHKNIVRYIDRCFQNGCLYIITEFVSGGSLDALVRTFRGLPRDIIRRYTGDILCGLQYLHERHIVHRDISPNNVLVSIDGVCKVTDFGGAAEFALQPASIDDGALSPLDDVESPTDRRPVMFTADIDDCCAESMTLKTGFGTPVCMSPEACLGNVDPKNDIWALGITLCFCVSGCHPWPPEELEDVWSFISKLRRRLLSPEPPFDLMDVHFADFVSLCLKPEARDRPTAAELLFHEFLVS